MCVYTRSKQLRWNVHSGWIYWAHLGFWRSHPKHTRHGKGKLAGSSWAHGNSLNPTPWMVRPISVSPSPVLLLRSSTKTNSSLWLCHVWFLTARSPESYASFDPKELECGMSIFPAGWEPASGWVRPTGERSIMGGSSGRWMAWESNEGGKLHSLGKARTQRNQRGRKAALKKTLHLNQGRADPDPGNKVTCFFLKKSSAGYHFLLKLNKPSKF